MAELNLLRSLPKSSRNVKAREETKTEEVIRISREFGFMYFDGPRDYGYGGYHYDGRWQSVARDIIAHFGLKPGDRVLDVGCAKGFLVKDLMLMCPGLEVFGLDVSEYAIMHCEPAVLGRLYLGDARKLPFPDNSFQCVLSLNTIHNFVREETIIALQEIQRISGGRAFIQVDSYRTPEQKAIFESWVLTALFHDYPHGWVKLFKEAGYTGAYDWTIID